MNMNANGAQPAGRNNGNNNLLVTSDTTNQTQLASGGAQAPMLLEQPRYGQQQTGGGGLVHLQTGQQHVKIENNHHAGPASSTRTSPASNNSAGAPYNLSTSSPSSASNVGGGGYQHQGQSAPVNGADQQRPVEYNLTTLQATGHQVGGGPSGQNQYSLQDGANNLQADPQKHETSLLQMAGHQTHHHQHQAHQHHNNNTHDVYHNQQPQSMSLQSQQQQRFLHGDQHAQVVTTNMILIDQKESQLRHFQSNGNYQTTLGAYETETKTQLRGQSYLNPTLDSLVRSFPTPEMSPHSSPEKFLVVCSSAAQAAAANDDQAQQQQQQQLRQQVANYGQGHANPASSDNNPTDSSAVDELIARFGDHSDVLKSVAPPYKYRMIVSASVANSLSDHSIQQQMRNDLEPVAPPNGGDEQLASDGRTRSMEPGATFERPSTRTDNQPTAGQHTPGNTSGDQSATNGQQPQQQQQRHDEQT